MVVTFLSLFFNCRVCTPSPTNSPVVGAVASPASPVIHASDVSISPASSVVVEEGGKGTDGKGTGGKGKGGKGRGGDRAAVAHVPKRQRVDVG